jgi:hypothetical protein
MISRPTLLSSCIVVAASLLSGSSEGFSNNVAQPKNPFERQIQVQPHVLSSSTMDDFDVASAEMIAIKKRKRVSASPESSYGKSNADELLNLQKPVGIESEFPKRKIKASVRETGTDSMKYYIKSMCNHELLNKNEEIILAREIQILLKWEKEREKLEEELLR